MSKLDRESALTKAEKFLEAESKEWNCGEVKTMRERAFQHESHMIVPYNTVAYTKTGNFEDGLVGNVPIRIDLKTGTCEFINLMKVFEYRDMGHPV